MAKKTEMTMIHAVGWYKYTKGEMMGGKGRKRQGYGRARRRGE